jgi:uncharacterized protein (DUF1501 family)
MKMKRDWFSCDGRGFRTEPTSSAPAGSIDGTMPSRRAILVGAALGAITWASRGSALAQVAIDPSNRDGRVLVVVFLRGGADGLNIVVPHGEDAYYRNRPSLGIPRRSLVDLDGFFGLNPALGPLERHFHEGRLAILHAVGSDDRTRSHFEAMNAMERGLSDVRQGAASGWLARHLAATEPARPSPLRAVAFGPIMPDSLRGGTAAIAIESLADFRLTIPKGASAEVIRTRLRELYRRGSDEMAVAGRETLDVLDSLARLAPQDYEPAGSAAYPESDLGQGLRQVALLVRAGVGLEVAALDKGGWDTHVAQGSTSGWLTALLEDLARSLDAFATDLGEEMRKVTMVVMTEFGRRVAENGGLGTDHGRASMMMVLGGGVRGGKVLGEWPGLDRDALEGPGDLRVTTDYRNVLAEVLGRNGDADLAAMFPGLRPRPVGLYG